MFDYVKGILKEAKPTHVVLETGGIGYKILIPLNAFSKLPPLEKKLLLYTQAVIREDAHTLFGFLNPEERELFLKCTSVSGIGPKTALAILGHLEARDLIEAIHHTDIQAICRVPGIGKKSAQRLILDMKDKAAELATSPKLKHPGGSLLSDAIQALINLGYQPVQAQKAVEKAHKENGKEDLSSLITSALRTT